MSKILTVGDLHGDYAAAEEAVNKFCRENYDFLIFMGDYVDSKVFTIKEQLRTITCVNDAMRYLPGQVIGLIGNHDHPNYIFNIECKNKQNEYADEIILALSEGDYQVAWEYNDYIFTHAGITASWEKKRRPELLKVAETIKQKALSDILNAMYTSPYSNYLFDIGTKRGGNEKHGGPIWADGEELYNKPLKNYNQVIGHTKVASVKRYIHNGDTLFFTNCLSSRGDNTYESCFLTLELPDDTSRRV
jgi:hypothetical protein